VLTLGSAIERWLDRPGATFTVRSPRRYELIVVDW
jgi:hypothetical protein